MRRLLKEIRKIRLINKLIRFPLKYGHFYLGGLLLELQKRWPPAGLVDCEFKGLKFRMYNECDDGLVYNFYYNVKYNEEADLSLFSELAKSSSCALDIGANTGLFSIISSITNPKLKIYAFEPYSVNAKRLALNIRANNANNVTIVNEALGDTQGTLEMAVPQDNSISTVVSANHQFASSIHPDVKLETLTVPISTIDNFRQKLELPIDLIKCDVETFEMSVFRGAFNSLKTDRPTIIFECFLDNERRLFFNNILETFDYFLYLILEEGIVYSKDGFPETNEGLNFLITPIRPIRNFISFKQTEFIRTEILLRPK